MTSLERRRRKFDGVRQKRCKNVGFNELRSLLEMHDWTLDRIAKNNHYIYVHPDYEGIVNLPKPHKGSDVKPVYCRHAIRAIEEVADYE
jgi:predicted RNA binding protein YcfA (HicA-like mRNA interferase family)